MNRKSVFSLAKDACEDAFRRIGQNAGETAGKIQETTSIDKLMEVKRRGMREILKMFPLEAKACPFCIKCRMESVDIDINCPNCWYGERKGICTNSTSAYNKMIKAHGEFITALQEYWTLEDSKAWQEKMASEMKKKKTYKVGDMFKIKGFSWPGDVTTIYSIGDKEIQLLVSETHSPFNKNKVRVNDINNITEEELRSMFVDPDTFDKAKLIDEEKEKR